MEQSPILWKSYFQQIGVVDKMGTTEPEWKNFSERTKTEYVPMLKDKASLNIIERAHGLLVRSVD